MKTTTFTPIVSALLLVALLGLAGCADDTPSSVPSSSVQADRLTALEAEVATLKEEAITREAAMKEELALIRQNLEHIQSMLAIEKESEKVMKTPPPSDDSVDKELEDAKTSFKESLDRMVDVTKKLLDKMEKEIDEQMKKLSPAPEGEEI